MYCHTVLAFKQKGSISIPQNSTKFCLNALRMLVAWRLALAHGPRRQVEVFDQIDRVSHNWDCS